MRKREWDKINLVLKGRKRVQRVECHLVRGGDVGRKVRDDDGK